MYQAIVLISGRLSLQNKILSPMTPYNLSIWIFIAISVYWFYEENKPNQTKIKKYFQ